jgi:tRNA threonylcarbamoyl adenosine modification protein YeaZ
VLVLAFDTSTPAVTVAVARFEPQTLPEGGWIRPALDGVRIVATRTEVALNRHGELLAQLIVAVLNEAGGTPEELAAIGVGLGPGPFTGLRVGIVTAKAMADALDIPAYGEGSLRLIGPTRSGVATNARRRQVYWAVYEGRQCLAGPDLASPEEAAAHFAEADVTIVSGEGPRLYPEPFAAFTYFGDHVYPRADQLVFSIAARVRAGAPGEDLTPMYLRRPDAQPPGPPKRVTPV